MKLVRYGNIGQEKPGVLDQQGVLRDLSAEVADINGASLSPQSLAKLHALDFATLPPVKGAPRLGACVATPGKFVGIGSNYRDHALESGAPIPAEPVVFYKTDTCICGANDNVMQPLQSTKLDWEVEIAIVMGSMARNVSEAEAAALIAGYCVVNDISERTRASSSLPSFRFCLARASEALVFCCSCFNRFKSDRLEDKSDLVWLNEISKSWGSRRITTVPAAMLPPAFNSGCT